MTLVTIVTGDNVEFNISKDIANEMLMLKTMLEMGNDDTYIDPGRDISSLRYVEDGEEVKVVPRRVFSKTENEKTIQRIPMFPVKKLQGEIELKKNIGEKMVIDD